MDDIVPGALQRLREADIVGLAGLTAASLGQEYCRIGSVSATKRQGARLSGAVEVPTASAEPITSSLPDEQTESENELSEILSVPAQHFEVEVEVMSRSSCQAVCTCGNQATLLCVHAAALLYQWIHHPYAFVPFFLAPEENMAVVPARAAQLPVGALKEVSSTASTQLSSRHSPLQAHGLPVNTVSETLAQFGLSELRAVAREYGIAVTGLGKQQLMETTIEVLSQPEAVRRVVGTLTKAQRQLLAAFALAGGSMSDEDLRSLFERFSLDSAGTLQEMLGTLQAKLLLVRTSLNHSLQQRLNLSLSPLDISWYIPQEIREALHVALPVTPFDVTEPHGKGSSAAVPLLRLAEPYKVLADMLLVARSLDGAAIEPQDKRTARNLPPLSAGRLSSDGSLALPAPEDQPSPAMIESLRETLSRSPAFLRFTFRLLNLSNILYKEDNWLARLRTLSDSAGLLLGPGRTDLLHELFTGWLNQASYAELFDLAESGIRVRCRATPLNQPALRRGELEQENSEARQELLSLLAQVPVGEWINFSAFARFIYRLHPTFLQRRQRLFPSPHWWIEQEEGRPLHPDQLSDWLRAEGRYLSSLLQGPLHWWGIADLAHSPQGQLLAFRLTALAGFFFQGLPAPPPPGRAEGIAPTSPVLTVTLDEQILIPCLPENWSLIACIEDFAESTGVEREQLSYRLNAHSLGEAISQGRDPRTLLELLQRTTLQGENNVYQELLASLERRIASYGRVRFYTDVSLLQVADTTVMQQLDAMTSLEEQTIRAIQPTLLILQQPGVERLLEELKRRGQAPLLHEEV